MVSQSTLQEYTSGVMPRGAVTEVNCGWRPQAYTVPLELDVAPAGIVVKRTAAASAGMTTSRLARSLTVRVLGPSPMAPTPRLPLWDKIRRRRTYFLPLPGSCEALGDGPLDLRRCGQEDLLGAQRPNELEAGGQPASGHGHGLRGGGEAGRIEEGHVLGDLDAHRQQR